MHGRGSGVWAGHKAAQSWLGWVQANGFVILVLGLWFSFTGLVMVWTLGYSGSIITIIKTNNNTNKQYDEK